EYDPATQRSVVPVVRTTLLPLTEFPRRQEILERVYARGAPDATDREWHEAGALPGWEFEAARLESSGNTLFQLSAGPGRPLVVLDESDALDEAAADCFSRLSGDGKNPGRAEDTAELFLSEEEWKEALESQQRLRLEHLSLRRRSTKAAELTTQPATRFHGNIPAFMAEVRSRLAANEQVMASAGSIGELERLTDLCREYELPYLLGELEDTATGVRLAEDSTAGSVSALVLNRAP